MPTSTLPTRALALLALAAFLVVTLAGWPTSPFWPDASGYADSILHLHWTAHPPGYLGFVALGRWFHLFFANAHYSAQLASFALTLTSFPVLFCALRVVLDARRSLVLVALFMTGWLPLMLARTGTSHAADLFTASLVLWAALRVSPEERVTATRCAAFFAALVLAAFFRLTTLLFFLPLALLLTVFHRKQISWWIGGLVSALAVLILQILVIRLSGGWEAYHTYAKAMHEGNAGASLLLSGFSKATLLNFGRAVGWWFLACLPAVTLTILLLFRGVRLSLTEPRLWILLAAVAGPLAGTALYLATHCGYLAPAVPATFGLTAYFWSRTALQKSQLTVALSVSLLFLLFFVLAAPLPNPRTPAQAAANALLLQYTNHGFQSSTWKSLSKWLYETGQGGLIPEERVRAMERPDAM